ncbi:MAG: hypothetical protein V9F00_02545 [Nocardioides sp.]
MEAERERARSFQEVGARHDAAAEARAKCPSACSVTSDAKSA